LRALFLASLLFLVPVVHAELRLSPPSPTRWAIDGGYGLRLWDASGVASQEQASYEEKAKRGWVLGGDVSVFPFAPIGLKPVGIGVSYFRFMTTITDSDIGFGDGSRGESTDIYLIEFLGPSLSWRQKLGRVAGIAQAGAGVLYYDNQHQASDFPGVLQSVAFGTYGALSVDYRILSWLGVGVTTRFLYGTLDNLDYNGIRVDVPSISLTRVDFAGGLRFYP
jgi:hypothetical protein